MSDPIAVLQRIRQTPQRPPSSPEERCELCGEGIAPAHGHLVDVQSRHLLCACRGCYLLFTASGAGGGHFRAIPQDYKRLPGSGLTAAQWESLQIPVSVAFFFMNSSLQKIAVFYPGPAGATESLLPLETWDELVEAHPVLAAMEPDVEALLVRVRPDRSGSQSFIVPIDTCYELVGHLRTLWRGFDGGQEARQAIEKFFEKIQERVG